MKPRYVMGVHSCSEVLKLRVQSVKKMWLKKGWEKNSHLKSFKTQAEKKEIYLVLDKPPSFFESRWGYHHQGVCLEVHESLSFDESYLEKPKGTLLFLDGVKDPQNLGALMRTAWLVGGVGGVFIPQEKATDYTPVAGKAASGAFEHIPLTSCHFVQKLKALKDKGYWIYGFSGKASKNLSDVKFHEKSVLILGGEEKGLRKSTENQCDHLVKIPQTQKDASYNVSVACAIALYERARRGD